MPEMGLSSDWVKSLQRGGASCPGNTYIRTSSVCMAIDERFAQDTLLRVLEKTIEHVQRRAE